MISLGGLIGRKNPQKNNTPNPHPIPDSTGTILMCLDPATYFDYLSPFKRTGYFGGTHMKNRPAATKSKRDTRGDIKGRVTGDGLLAGRCYGNYK